jgi:hypothetical protein
MKIKVTKTYQTVTPESASNGDFADDGFIYTDSVMSLRELIDEVKDLGYYEWSSSHPQCGDWIIELDGEMDINDGSFTTHALHFLDGLKPHQANRIIKVLNSLNIA